MDWNKIKNDYPAAWEAFLAFLDTEHGVDIYNDDELYINDDSRYYENRELYDFFDEKGIYINVTFFTGTEADPKKNCFEYDIDLIDRPSPVRDFSLEFASRTEAEAAAFERAFSILNSIAQPEDILTVKEK